MMLTTSQVARMLNITVLTAGRYCARGSIKAININPNGKLARWRIPSEEVEKFTGMKVVLNDQGQPILK